MTTATPLEYGTAYRLNRHAAQLTKDIQIDTADGPIDLRKGSTHGIIKMGGTKGPVTVQFIVDGQLSQWTAPLVFSAEVQTIESLHPDYPDAVKMYHGLIPFKTGLPKQYPYRLELRYGAAEMDALKALTSVDGIDTSTVIRKLILDSAKRSG